MISFKDLLWWQNCFIVSGLMDKEEYADEKAFVKSFSDSQKELLVKKFIDGILDDKAQSIFDKKRGELCTEKGIFEYLQKQKAKLNDAELTDYLLSVGGMVLVKFSVLDPTIYAFCNSEYFKVYWSKIKKEVNDSNPKCKLQAQKFVTDFELLGGDFFARQAIEYCEQTKKTWGIEHFIWLKLAAKFNSFYAILNLCYFPVACIEVKQLPDICYKEIIAFASRALSYGTSGYALLAFIYSHIAKYLYENNYLPSANKFFGMGKDHYLPDVNKFYAMVAQEVIRNLYCADFVKDVSADAEENVFCYGIGGDKFNFFTLFNSILDGEVEYVVNNLVKEKELIGFDLNKLRENAKMFLQGADFYHPPIGQPEKYVSDSDDVVMGGCVSPSPSF